jgi:hypothetical protein
VVIYVSVFWLVSRIEEFGVKISQRKKRVETCFRRLPGGFDVNTPVVNLQRIVTVTGKFLYAGGDMG